MKTSTKIIAVLAAAATTLGLLTAAADAAVLSTGYKIHATRYADGAWMGSYRLTSNNNRGYRVDPRANTLDPSYGPITWVSNFSKTTGVTKTAQAAYVLSAYGTTTDSALAAGVNVAELALLHGGQWRLGQTYTTNRIHQTPWPSYVTSDAKTLLANAARYAGPYKVSTSATTTAAGSSSTVTYKILSASGHALPKAVNVTLRSNGHTITASTNASGIATLSVPTNAPGPQTYTATVSGLAATRLAIVKPKAKGASRLAIAGKPTTVTAGGTVTVTTTQAAAFNNGAAQRSAGQSLSGTATLTGGYGPRSLTFALYRSSSSTTGCTGTPIATHVQTVNGAGTVGSPVETSTSVGYYRWDVTVTNNTWTTNTANVCGSPVQVVPISQKVTLATSPTHLTLKQIMQSHATVTGGYSSRSLTFKLYRSTSKTMACSGTPIYTHTQTISGAGSYSTMKWTVQGVYYFRWYVTVASNNDTSNTASACGPLVTVTK